MPCSARKKRQTALAGLVAISLLSGCGSTSSGGDTTSRPQSTAATESSASNPDESSNDRFPSVLDAEATLADDGTWTIAATLSSPYDSTERYADAWRVLDESGAELALRELAHDHASEQPFTRNLGGIEIPETVETVTIEGRDLKNGWGGQTFSYKLPR